MKNSFIDDKLHIIDKSISTGVFEDVEDSKLELKDLSTGNDWVSFKQTICAFLNTNGGYILCGIREKNRTYRVTGFDRNNEGNIIDLRNKFFRTESDNIIDLSDYIDFDYIPFQGSTLAVISVRPLSEDLKFVKFEDKYYERVLTADKIISKNKIEEHSDYKQELEYSKELLPVNEASLSDLDLEKINQFVFKVNNTLKKETIKKDLEDSRSFLMRRHCLKDNKVTTLGMLLFGSYPSYFLEYRTEIDCFFGDDSDIALDKRDFQDDVLSLMDNAFKFIWGHIKVGRTAKDGGRAEPEYPEKLIREVINNALAHRDYTINKFITIRVRPNEYLEIKNPGSFKSKMLITDKTSGTEIRRIIPGIPETKNPKLASILKSYDKIESQGIGMATLVSLCLENVIDVPFYEIEPTANTISLKISSGKLLDDEVNFWLNSFNNYIAIKLGSELSLEHKKVLAYFYKSEKLNEKRKYTILLDPSNNHFDILKSLKKAKLIEEHVSSREDAQVYILDRELLKVDFEEEIESFLLNNNTQNSITQVRYKTLDKIQRCILNIIYRNSRYNKSAIKPSQITPELYLLEFGKTIDPKSYETLGRKARKICEFFAQQGIIVKDSQTKGYLFRLSDEF